MIIWLTGNSGAGKSSLAKALTEKLKNWIILDGNEMRNSISLGAGFSKEDREEHNLRVARLANILSKQVNIIISVIAPFKSTREKIDKIIDCKWIYLNRTTEVKKDYPYEVPEDPSLVLDIDNMNIEEEVKEIIEKLRLFNVYVFGLPRSGTSMMTRIIELLGVNVIHTSEEHRAEADKIYKKTLGDYHPNKTGFFEVTKDFFGNYIKILNTPYSGCKMIIPVVAHRLSAVMLVPSKVIMMFRDPEEIRQSQMAYYKRGQKVDVAFLRTALVQEKIKLEKSKIDFICVEYRDVLSKPRAEIERVGRFIHSNNDIQPAVDFVNPEANRYKKEELEVGI